MRQPGWRPLALMLASSGVLHLVRPQLYEPLIPRQLGDRRAWVLGSGAVELACAAALVAPRTRSRAGWACAALLVAVFPGNVQHAVGAWRSSRAPLGLKLGTLARLPVQAPLVGWAVRVAREAEAGAG